MNSRNKFIVAVMLAATVLFPSCASTRHAGASQQQPDNAVLPAAKRDVKSSVIDSIVCRYSNWGSVELNGKLSMEGLPVSPSVRIYMKKGTDLMISARAPFIGEAIRIDITGDSLLMINKLKKTYCRESASALSRLYPGAVADLQSLLLGRIVIPGTGELSLRNASAVEVAPDDNGEWVVAPDLGALPLEAVMGYLVSPDGELRSMAAALNETNMLAIGYQWRGNNLRALQANLERNGKIRSVSLTFDTPKWGAAPMSPAKISGKLRKVGLKEFIGGLTGK